MSHSVRGSLRQLQTCSDEKRTKLHKRHEKLWHCATAAYSCRVVAVTKVAQAGNNVLVRIEVRVDDCSHDANFRIRLRNKSILSHNDPESSHYLGDCANALRAGDNIEEQDTLFFRPSFDQLLKTQFDSSCAEQSRRTLMAMVALPPVASIGSTKMTCFFEMSGGNLA